MKKYYIGILFMTCFIYASSNKPRDFSDYQAYGTSDWNWINKGELDEAQASQINWPSNGNGGSIKGKGDSNPNRDGSWAQDNWPPGGNRNDGSDMGWDKQPQGNRKGSAYPDGGEDQEGDLETILRGVPGMDFPNFVTVPDTDFDCSSMPSQGYYGDVDAGCQVFHICQPGNRKDSFLCPVGTIFNQKYFVCDWWFNVNCSDTPSYYELNNEVYKDPVAVTEEVPVTTEKNMPWNSQDLDRKKPTKSWGNQPSSGKQNPNWKGTPSRRGSKSPGSVSTSKEVSNSWSRSDVQKEVTLSWGAASSSPSETYASSLPTSNYVIPTTKPIWYGIDGQPAKDQSNGMSKRVGLMPTPASFGTRIRKTNGWPTDKPYNSATSPVNRSSYKITTADMKIKGISSQMPSSTNGGWQKNGDIPNTFKTESGIKWNNNVDYDYSSTKSWLKAEDIPKTSINPTGIKGIWEQQTTETMNAETSINPIIGKSVWESQITKGPDFETSINPTGIKGVWEQQTTKKLDPETSLNPTAIKGVWKQQTTKRMDSDTSINPTGIKGVWEQQTTKKSNEDYLIGANTLKNKGFETKSHLRQKERKFQTASNQRNEWNQRQVFKNIRSSTAINRGWVQNNSRKRKALKNTNLNAIPHQKNWK